jgi:hypothetical protein
MSSLSYVSDEFLLAQAGIDTEKFKLGKLCKRGHDWEGTGKTLKYVRNTQCPTCRGVKNIDFAPVKTDPEILFSEHNIDPSRFRLGKICPNNHEWENTGKSLRTKNTGACIICSPRKHLSAREEFPQTLFSEEEKIQFLQDHDIDPNLFYLTPVCKNRHNWMSTGFSLRMIRKDNNIGSCVDCHGLKNPGRNSYKLGRPKYDQMVEDAGYSTELVYLGVLCKKNHDWKQTGYSLRYKRHNSCVECLETKRIGIRDFSGTREDNFWLRVVKKGENECWEWRAGRSSFGHGCFKLEDGSYIGAHRYSYILHYGEIEGDLHVRHKCDNPPCVNPNHLCLGTHQQNMNDMVERGRSVKGEDRPTAKLTEEKVREARILYDSGTKSINELAEQMGVAKTTIRMVVKRLTWKHVD